MQITDFGLSNIMSASNILRSKCGTPVYMGKNPSRAQFASGPGPVPCVTSNVYVLRAASAPEMLQNRPYNELVDVWAAGILLYIMCVNLPVLFLALPHCIGT